MATESITLKSDAAYAYNELLSTQAGATSSNGLTTDDYWKLMAAQLQYQDMSNPMNNSEMMNQMVQMSSMSAMSKLSEAVANFSVVTNNLSTVTLTSYSTGMIGKKVTVAITEKDEETGETIVKEKIQGIVTGVDLTGTTSVYVDGKRYELSQIMAVGDVPEDDKTDDSASEETDKDDTAETKTV